MSTLRIIIADDERPARKYVRGLLESYDDVSIVGEAHNGPEAVALIEQESPDLALLDLQMPEMNGLEVAQMIQPAKMPLVAFITAHDAYAVQAFEVHAVDYLLKPVDPVRLRATVSRAIDLLDQGDFRTTERDRVDAATQVIQQHEPATPLRRIPVRRRDDIIFVAVDDVASFIADGELLRITTHAGERYIITHRLKEIEQRLDDAQFIRMSRSSLVNVDAIVSVSPMPGGTFVITLSNKQQLSVSRSRSKVLRETLLRL